MAISKSNRVLKFRATQDLIALLNYLENAKFGITDAGIAAITSSGTTAKLKTYIAGLTKMRAQDVHYRNAAAAMIDRCVAMFTLTSAMVETARAAGTFAALRTAIIDSSGVTGLSATAQPFQLWA